MAHTQFMFLNDPLATTFGNDRQARFRRAATRRRLVSRNKVPPADVRSATALAVDWSDDANILLSQPRAHCVA